MCVYLICIYLLDSDFLHQTKLYLISYSLYNLIRNMISEIWSKFFWVFFCDIKDKSNFKYSFLVLAVVLPFGQQRAPATVSSYPLMSVCQHLKMNILTLKEVAKLDEISLDEGLATLEEDKVHWHKSPLGDPCLAPSTSSRMSCTPAPIAAWIAP